MTTVNGNTDVDTATRLTLELLDRLGRDDVPVARGAAAPLLRPARARPTGTEAVLPRASTRADARCPTPHGTSWSG